MHENLREHFRNLHVAMRATGLSANRRKYVAGLIEQLPALYAKYRETSESRFGDEITELVQIVLRTLEAVPAAQELDAPFRAKLRLLHEELGVPQLPLKPVTRVTPPPAPKKSHKKK
jgi:hypothetical protein